MSLRNRTRRSERERFPVFPLIASNRPYISPNVPPTLVHLHVFFLNDCDLPTTRSSTRYAWGPNLRFCNVYSKRWNRVDRKALDRLQMYREVADNEQRLDLVFPTDLDMTMLQPRRRSSALRHVFAGKNRTSLTSQANTSFCQILPFVSRLSSSFSRYSARTVCQMASLPNGTFFSSFNVVVFVQAGSLPPKGATSSATISS